MVLENRLRAQGVAGRWRTAEEAVAKLGAVQAQDYLGALWAVGLRVSGAREADVERALAERTIVRTWPMRGTLHFVAAKDVRWMLNLLGRRAVAGAAGRMRALGIDAGVLGKARRAIVKELEGGRSLTRPRAHATLERAKIATADMRGLHVLWSLAHEGVICFGRREGKQQTFVLLDEWVPAAKALERDDALGEVAARYFGGHGPATMKDFAWWTGLTLTEARRAVEIAGERVVQEELEGTRFWRGHAGTGRAKASREDESHGAHVLPAFDEMLVGYADRSAAIAETDARRVTAGGIFSPTILAGGRVVGTWKRRIEKRKVFVEAKTFATTSGRSWGAIEDAFERYARFLAVELGGVSRGRSI